MNSLEKININDNGFNQMIFGKKLFGMFADQ